MSKTLFAALIASGLATAAQAAPFAPMPVGDSAPQIIKVGSRASSTLIVYSEKDLPPDDDLGSADGYTANATEGGSPDGYTAGQN